MDIVSYFQDGGAFMYPILLVFLIGLVFVIERLIFLIKSTATKESFAIDIANTISSKGGKKALEACKGAVGPIATLCNVAATESNHGPEAVEKALDQSGNMEMANMEKNMTWIALAIAVAPMLGFLGTVVGMVEAFEVIANSDDINAGDVAGGISKALLTTAFGLICAVVLQMLQNGVMYIIDNIVVGMQKSSLALIKSVETKVAKK